MHWVRYCLCVLSAAAVFAASAVPAAVYTCRCQGITKRFLFFSFAQPCGNGYVQAQPGEVIRPVPVGQLSRYLPREGVHEVLVRGCAVSARSGWGCATVTGTGVPACLED
jgi:hypothetical protein